jgi:hypothetical protein
MDGGRSRDLVALRIGLAVACVALTAFVAAPAALATSPATDQYGSALPGGGGGGSSSTSGGSGSGSTSESSDSSGGGVTIPIAPDTGSQSQGSTSTDTGGTSTGGGSASGGSNGGAAGHGNGSPSVKSPTKHGAVVGSPAGHSVPQIAADSAGDSWLPFFIAGMVALACAAAALIYRNRRRTAQS